MCFYMVPQPGFEPGKAWCLRPLGVPISTSHRGKIFSTLLKNVCSDYSACRVLWQLLLEQIEDFTPLFGLLGYKVTNPGSASFSGCESKYAIVCVYSFAWFTVIAYRAVHSVSSRNRNHDRPISKHTLEDNLPSESFVDWLPQGTDKYAYWWIGRESNPRLACIYIASYSNKSSLSNVSFWLRAISQHINTQIPPSSNVRVSGFSHNTLLNNSYADI